ncbi:MAG: NAD(P)-dependent oxidoreductase [Clostridium sp.]|uniref:NAD(P)-dependent oxidoreductase n=1 Tax=Clostridium sp. TaxID=1506 RepID=UPI0025C3C013|nr:NAD(P)-dependent oxidoreductase [Clostridium sp.]MCE5220853.1 NAD(P)-dependent oxidoreductase [Clostridium sp.]
MFLLDEANRCLLCKNPKCQANCPINTPIPEIIALYKDGRLKEAGEILFNNNPLSVICSIVCPHENQCAGNCIRGIKQEPVKFYDIEKEISEGYLDAVKFENLPKDKDRIAIIGGGPAGLTIAFILARKGYKVTIFDSKNKIGGVLRYGIPEYRLPNYLIDKLEDKLIELGVMIRPNTLIGPVISIDRLFEEDYKAIFIGTGVWNAKTLNIKGETLGNVHFAIDYLRSPETYRLGNKVAIIGAGNVAMDAARTAKRNGCNEVTVIYRGNFEDMSATKREIEEAKEDGILFKLYSSPIELTEEGVKIINKENQNNEKEELFECNSTIIAISQSPKTNIVSNTTKLETNSAGLIIADEKGNTTRSGVFGSGDVVTGARTVVEAVAHAKIVAEAIEEYCRSTI